MRQGRRRFLPGRAEPLTPEVAAFSGAKALLLCGPRLAVLRRDARGDIPYPARIDLPGGAREGSEGPVACALREVAEEIGLRIAPDRVRLSKDYPGAPLPSWLVFAEITENEAGSLRLGAEGQACWMMEVGAYLAARDAIPHQQERVAAMLRRVGGPDPMR